MSSMIDPAILRSSIIYGTKRVLALSAAIGHDTGFILPSSEWSTLDRLESYTNTSIYCI